MCVCVWVWVDTSINIIACLLTVTHRLIFLQHLAKQRIERLREDEHRQDLAWLKPQVPLSSSWRSPTGGALQQLTLSYRWRCPTGGTVQQVAVYTVQKYRASGADLQMYCSDALYRSMFR